MVEGKFSIGTVQEGIQRWLNQDKRGICPRDAVLRRMLSTYVTAEKIQQQSHIKVQIKIKEKCRKIRKVLVIYTGGTIGMQQDESGALVPAYEALEKRLKCYPELHDPTEYKKLIKHGFVKDNEHIMVIKNVHDDYTLVYQIYEYETLLDSSDMNNTDWIKIVTDIERFYDGFDGFVVLHGTDTLSFTASALSFMLEYLQKPVILTGAQKSIFESHSDAKNNIVNSLIFASMDCIQEVCVCFSNKLIRGNRCVKDSAMDLEAFHSPNYPNLAKIKVHITVYKDLLLKIHRPRSAKIRVHKHLEKNVSIIKFHPLLTLDVISSFLKPPTKGLVMETYGTGNVPNMPGLTEALQNAVQVHSIMIVNVTQCSKGSVGAFYPMAQTLEKIGVIAGNDMTVEAAVCKLSYVLARNDWPIQQKILAMKTNLCGEMSFPGEYFDVYR